MKEPSSEIEKNLVKIWQKILNTENISINDKFFDIGGNSILVIQMHGLIEKQYPGKVAVTDLFSYPTIAKLAEFIEDGGKAKTGKIKSVAGNEKEKANIQTQTENGKEIAIIGICAKLPLADSVDEFWENLRDGVDCVRGVPKSREKDVEGYLRAMGIDPDSVERVEAAYLDEIDKFDYKYFKLSPKESELMDPNQRLFLETAWNAIEDSGYGGKKLVGSRTGVYLGFGSDPDYKRLISMIEPSSMSMALAGNVRPIIASRLSYLMDFRGPSVTVDTTCSSSLVATHLACQSIRNGECELAIAGGVQLHMMPVRQTKVGVESSTSRTKAFDDSSDGTGTGEGVIAIVLKPLSKALKDGDSIYAVIKGSAMNQDGMSIGITAPNAAAQEDVIVNAWKNAGVSPETITYIEAHGTGTKLGDPIEIDGMTRAFRRFTDKKQFCAVGSVKTNIGHLDNSAGVAGLLKAVLSLKNRQIPESLHFSVPNHKINFKDSPVYVNNKLTDWRPDGIPRRCGVSAFGLSGTNCHIVLEEAPAVSEQNAEINNDKLNVLTISAKNQTVLKKLVESYSVYLDKEDGLLPSDICYTANTGRGHYNSRLAVVFRDIEELKSSIETISSNDFSDIRHDRIFFGEHKVVSLAKASGEDGEVTEEEISENSKKANLAVDEFLSSDRKDENVLSELCRIYIKGADVDWDRLYKNENPKVLHLPVYPFERIRCWLEVKPESGKTVSSAKTGNKTDLPLLDTNVVESLGLDIFNTNFSVERHWMLNEHRIMGECILVGTTYLEIAIEACKKYFGDGAVEIKDVTFLSTMAVKPGEERETQTIVKKQNSYYEFTVISRLKSDERDQWIKHVEGKICAASAYQAKKVDLEQLMTKYKDGYFVPDIDSYNSESAFEFGPRWKNISGMYVGENELLSHIKMPEQFVNELVNYTIYPSVLDNALATMPLLDKALNSRPFSGENGIFLPFSYKAIRIYKPLPAEFYSCVKLKSELNDKSAMVTFDIALADMSGEVFADIEAYSLKKADKAKMSGEKNDIFYKLAWVPVQLEKSTAKQCNGSVLIFQDKNGLGNEIGKKLKDNGKDVIVVQNGGKYELAQDGIYTVGSDEADYVSLMEGMKNRNVTWIIHMFALDNKTVTNIDEFDQTQNNGINSVFKLTRAILKNNLNQDIEIAFIAEYADGVSNKESELKPENSTMFGMVKVIGEEYKNLKCRCIDIDNGTKAQQILDELNWGADAANVAYREGVRYQEEIRPLDIDALPDSSLKLSENGIYIITGGTGGIGIETAKHLASKGKVNLALINRSEFPASEQWDGILLAGENQKLCNKIKAIREMQKAGSTVICCKADVSDEEDLRPLIESLRNRFGRINGVIHSAGVAGDGFIVKKEKKTFDEVIFPKTRGTWLLNELTEQDNPDFFVMFSSNNTLLGMPGQGDYTAANSFLGAFSSYRNKQGKSTVTINWPAWKETGMAADHGVNIDNIFKVLPTSAAMAAFDKILAKTPEKVVVGELNYGGTINGKTIFDVDMRLADEIKTRIEKQQKASIPKTKNSGGILQQDIKLTGKKTGGYTKTETKVALIWKEVLGFDEFNIYDDFFDLGGDSIMITKVKSLIVPVA
ncbi:MAG TPA: SDR family NAD(P)-dependent oxidoreductase [Ruminiclostridium sp.]|nr:SDR family NAD(P)-dependent oxidoreductase [Ruminiclostridium sp.]